jgi:hypothetical protein
VGYDERREGEVIIQYAPDMTPIQWSRMPTPKAFPMGETERGCRFLVMLHLDESIRQDFKPKPDQMDAGTEIEDEIVTSTQIDHNRQKTPGEQYQAKLCLEAALTNTVPQLRILEPTRSRSPDTSGPIDYRKRIRPEDFTPEVRQFIDQHLPEGESLAALENYTANIKDRLGAPTTKNFRTGKYSRGKRGRF